MCSETWRNPKTVKLKDGTEVVLRPSQAKDLEPTWEMFSTLSRDTLQYLPDPITRERVEGWFKEINYEEILPILGIIENESGYRIISSITLHFRKGIYSHVAGFGITVHDEYQNKGFGHILTRYMLDIAIELGVKKVVLNVVSHNHRAIHVYEKMGFEREGFKKMDHWNPILERYGDDIIMGILLDSTNR
jgi:RimJ/RimL family protein N-acetyltransferase